MKIVSRRRWLQLAGAAWAWPCMATALQAPEGRIVLTIRGLVQAPNQGRAAAFDMPMLEHMPQHDITTITPWFTKPRRFTGPLLRDVLASAGAQGKTLRAVALNDYRVEIPFDDAQRYDVVLARLLDGKAMSVREKGPLFIIYPFDKVPELRNAVYFSRCAWQLKSIDVS